MQQRPFFISIHLIVPPLTLFYTLLSIIATASSSPHPSLPLLHLHSSLVERDNPLSLPPSSISLCVHFFFALIWFCPFIHFYLRTGFWYWSVLRLLQAHIGNKHRTNICGNVSTSLFFLNCIEDQVRTEQQHNAVILSIATFVQAFNAKMNFSAVTVMGL